MVDKTGGEVPYPERSINDPVDENKVLAPIQITEKPSGGSIVNLNEFKSLRQPSKSELASWNSWLADEEDDRASVASKANESTIHNPIGLDQNAKIYEAHYGNADTFAQGFQNGVELIRNGVGQMGFTDLFEQLAAVRQHIANSQVSPEAHQFGVIRKHVHYNPKTATTALTQDLYGHQLPTLRAFMLQQTGSTHGEYTHFMTLTNKREIPLTTLDLSEDLPKKVGAVWSGLSLVHTHTQYMNECMIECEMLFDRLGSLLIDGNKEAVIDELSKLVFLFDHAMPCERGSSSIGEMLAEGVLNRLDIRPDRSQFKGLDFLAFTHTQSEFSNAFRERLGLTNG